MNYRNEKEHDHLLIKLAEDLGSQNRLDILGNALKIEGRLGELERKKPRRPFDVELTFSNLSVVIETKVDSDEDGRFENEWQTERIKKQAEVSCRYLKPKKEFIFITYGTSEFYTRHYETGPASTEFRHIRLEDMIALVEASDRVLPRCDERREWLELMQIEKEKRSSATDLLRSFSEFRKQYLKIHRKNDFPRNRLLFCAPELAFPALSSLARKWNDSEHKDRFGRVSLYPIGRLTPPIHDSILNFWEMWREPELPTFGKTILGNEEGGFYLEINEDFNLNIKLNGEVVAKDKKKLWDCLEGAAWPSFIEKCRRDYTQGVQVLYEIDFGFLDELNDMGRVIKNLASTLDILVEVLGN